MGGGVGAAGILTRGLTRNSCQQQKGSGQQQNKTRVFRSWRYWIRNEQDHVVLWGWTTLPRYGTRGCNCGNASCCRLLSAREGALPKTPLLYQPSYFTTNLTFPSPVQPTLPIPLLLEEEELTTNHKHQLRKSSRKTSPPDSPHQHHNNTAAVIGALFLPLPLPPPLSLCRPLLSSPAPLARWSLPLLSSPLSGREGMWHRRRREGEVTPPQDLPRPAAASS